MHPINLKTVNPGPLNTGIKNVFTAALSGLLLTGAFPKIGLDWLAWVALVPLLYTLKDQPVGTGFRLGFITGLVHFLMLLYWLVPVMRTYGYLPAYLSILILLLFAAFLALFVGSFAAALSKVGKSPVRCLVMIPLLWVALEYLRSFIFSGFPWELLGYSQFNRLQLIQISDILGIYGLSAFIALVNGAVFITLLYFTKKRWLEENIPKHLVTGAVIALILGIALSWSYGHWRLKTIDHLIAISPKTRIAVVQGNIDQAVKFSRSSNWGWTMSRQALVDLFAACRSEQRAALMPYMTAGLPTPDDSVRLFTAMAEAGAGGGGEVRPASRDSILTPRSWPTTRCYTLVSV